MPSASNEEAAKVRLFPHSVFTRGSYLTTCFHSVSKTPLPWRTALLIILNLPKCC